MKFRKPRKSTQPELTKSRIDAAGTPEPGQRIELWDGRCPGLVLRVGAEARTWVFVYRSGTVRHKFKLGTYPALEIKDAREAAHRRSLEIASGSNPAEDRRQRREELTLADLFARYKAERLLAGSLRTGAAVARSIEIHVLRLGDDGKPREPIARRKLTEITTTDVAQVQKRISAAHPTQANRVGAHVSAMFGWAMRQRPPLASANPWEGRDRNPETRRERYASDEETRAIKAAIDGLEDRTAAAAIELLLLTGARSGETRRAKWEDVDLTAGTWSKPAATTKTRLPHKIPLSPRAVALLAGLKDGAESEWIFPNAAGDGPMPSHVLDNRWRKVRAAAGVKDFRKHDLRHSFASVLVSGKASLPIVGALLGHTTPATTARYAHLADNPLRAAVKLADRRFAEPKAGKGAEVVALKATRQ